MRHPIIRLLLAVLLGAIMTVATPRILTALNPSQPAPIVVTADEVLAPEQAQPLRQTFQTNCAMGSPLILSVLLAWHGLDNHLIPPPYISTDTLVIENQIQAAKARGVNGFVVDWFGPAEGISDTISIKTDRAFIDEATAKLLQAAAEQDFCVALMYDVQTISATEALTTMYQTRAISDLLYAVDNYLTSPVYLTLDNKPAIFIFPNDVVDPYLNWSEIRATLSVEVVLLDKDPNPLAPAYDAQFDGFYGWVQPTGGNWSADGQEWGEGYLDDWLYPTLNSITYTDKISAGPVWAGFDDSPAAWGQGRYISRRCGQTWQDTWALANKYNPPIVLIVTWNDFEEGTDIEYGIVKLDISNDSPTVLGNATTLTATLLDCDDVTYTWDFGDGTGGSGPVVSHTYAATGTYTAIVTASNVTTTVTGTTVVTVDTPQQTVCWQEDFDPLVWSQWQDADAWEDIPGPRARLRESDPITNYDKVETEIITIDIDTCPFLRVIVTDVETDALYTIQILDKATDTPYDVRKELSDSGEHVINLAEELIWQGVHSFTINLWIVGEGKSAEFDLVRLESFTVTIYTSIYLPIVLK